MHTIHLVLASAVFFSTPSIVVANEGRDNYVTMNLSFPTVQLQVFSPGKSKMISYAPDGDKYLGVGMSYDDYTFNFGYDFGFLNDGSSTSQFDIRLGRTWDKLAVDTGFANYAGFNIVNSKGFEENEIAQHSYVYSGNDIL